MLMLVEPERVMTGGVSSTTRTVLTCCTAGLPELSVTSYRMVYVPVVEASTVPVTTTLPVMSPSWSSVAV